MKETIVVRVAPNFGARRFIATFVVLAMSVLGPLATGTPVLAHQWGWGQLNGTNPNKVNAHMTATSYASGMQYMQAHMFVDNANHQTVGEVNASCSVSCTSGQYTTYVIYPVGSSSMSRHCAKNADGHRTPNSGNIPPGHPCVVNVGHYALKFWTPL